SDRVERVLTAATRGRARAPTAAERLGHPDGEKILTRAAAAKGIIQMIPTLASCSLDEITGARTGDQIQLLTTPNAKNKKKPFPRNWNAEKLVKRAAERGCRAIFLTVDAPQIGRREKDMRLKYVDEAPHEQRDEGMEVDRSQGAGRAISSFVSPSLCWKDIPWLRSLSNLPLVLKGVQTVEDALLAAEHGCEGIVLSNHGGRQVDYARCTFPKMAIPSQNAFYFFFFR
ncbi:MAG: FMN-dependent dehydrogenase, partial [Olpidium bornovanus]